MNANKSTTPAWFITGCSTGLGRALAEGVLRHGYRCVATARNPADIADIVRAHPNTSVALALDVTDDKQRHDVVARAEEAFGGIDVLVNNAGHGYSAAIEEGEEDEIRRMFETNFFALAAMTRLVLSRMRPRGRGHIVNIHRLAAWWATRPPAITTQPSSLSRVCRRRLPRRSPPWAFASL
jgi:NAD(P)-dependent dehydrogenase (short-subunit alcohol dehydrogenase family)